MTEYMRGLLEGYNRCIMFIDKFDAEASDLQMQILKGRLKIFVDCCCPPEKVKEDKNKNNDK